MYDLTSPFEAVIEGNGRLILVLDVPGGGVRGGVGGVPDGVRVVGGPAGSGGPDVVPARPIRAAEV